MGTKPIRMVVDGQEFSIAARPGEPEVYDFDWLDHPAGYGFMSAAGPMSWAEMRDAIEDLLVGIDSATGFLGEPTQDPSAPVPAPTRRSTRSRRR